MADLLWEQVAEIFDPELVGALPDLVVDDAGMAGWQALLELIAEQDWPCTYEEGGTVRPIPADARRLWNAVHEDSVELRVRPTPGMLVIFRAYAPESIDFDVDLRELQGQQQLDAFCAFLRTVGRHLDRQVLMYAEGDAGHPLLRFDAASDRLKLLAESPQA
ncbi:hypothetical protein [Streptomyces boninensis]|uniref:hypothetical protein n=1 Tax=Streptomyces boninensis TaxID=2039455 RepID=UPI003B20C057